MKVFVLTAGGVDKMTFEGPFQPLMQSMDVLITPTYHLGGFLRYVYQVGLSLGKSIAQR